ncbi:uncharacterized protein N0V89_001403 [Didymosphaeria variabile]|uniref:Uncharacterized protein n=1 Tax=Didymosphaeria variabile TaxID=1932322 RepID=A0A9W8XX56_9PLEO|nr:uncharacterized protein N0V89_001403 [Didymosphaeria variabile]KAJ4360836.1 hypothetical protein N0V89_001403 [Didymosphaeria variabile]
MYPGVTHCLVPRQGTNKRSAGECRGALPDLWSTRAGTSNREHFIVITVDAAAQPPFDAEGAREGVTHDLPEPCEGNRRESEVEVHDVLSPAPPVDLTRLKLSFPGKVEVVEAELKLLELQPDDEAAVDEGASDQEEESAGAPLLLDHNAEDEDDGAPLLLDHDAEDEDDGAPLLLDHDAEDEDDGAPLLLDHDAEDEDEGAPLLLDHDAEDEDEGAPLLLDHDAEDEDEGAPLLLDAVETDADSDHDLADPEAEVEACEGATGFHLDFIAAIDGAPQDEEDVDEDEEPVGVDQVEEELEADEEPPGWDQVEEEIGLALEEELVADEVPLGTDHVEEELGVALEEDDE